MSVKATSAAVKQRGLEKLSRKVFLKIPEKIVDKAVTKEHVYKRRKKRRE